MAKHVAARPIDEARALSMLRAGRSPLATARAMRVHVARIVALADRRGVPHSVLPSLSAADEARVLGELGAGRTVEEIARGLCVCDGTVRALLRRLGAPAPRYRTAVRRDAPTFVCAACGRRLPLLPSSADDPAGCLTVGGRTLCGPCAARRFPRRPDPDCPLCADYVELRHQAPVGLRTH